ncbi:MAG: galactokinase [Treponema sp.]|nr:galactokinase [Treponema sp.]
MNGKMFVDYLDSPGAGELFVSLYGEDGVDTARRRYRRLVEGLLLDGPDGFPRSEFPEAAGELRLFTVPGRTELGGNHTDHNRGKVLAASIQLDAVAFAAPRPDTQVFFRSAGHRDIKVDISDLSPREGEKGNSEALVRGIAAEFAAQGTPVGGFTANAANAVLTGSGLSSSAAVEVLFAKIFDNLYCGGKRSALELAKIGQKAENLYFGKPCGLMDQTACAWGGAAAIDFADSQNPLVRGIAFDPAAAGFALCVVNTRGSHSDLTPDYAAIPAEMKAVAGFFGKEVLRELDEETLLGRITEVRAAAGDRAVLRALHYYGENRRVDAKMAALETAPVDMETFLALVRESGDSSWELLQNIYSPKKPNEQGLSVALALTKRFLGSGGGACRVHGGGFAGTIQTYLPLQKLEEYRSLMEGIFGKGALTVLRIRPLGAAELLV